MRVAEMQVGRRYRCRVQGRIETVVVIAWAEQPGRERSWEVGIEYLHVDDDVDRFHIIRSAEQFTAPHCPQCTKGVGKFENENDTGRWWRCRRCDHAFLTEVKR